MNPKMLRAMRPKKKRAVDPNAPPRPNLMTHEVRLREQMQSVADLQHVVFRLQNEITELRSKLNRQTDYIQALTQRIYSNK
jgi:uncharacterized coiled-coil protein SlyX